MMQLRNKGIYRLPGQQRKIFALAFGEGEFRLYDCEFGMSLPPRFNITKEKNITNWFGVMPVFTVDDLIDTGETQSDLRLGGQ